MLFHFLKTFCKYSKKNPDKTSNLPEVLKIMWKSIFFFQANLDVMTTVFFYYDGKQGKPFYFFGGGGGKDILFFQQYRFKEVKKFLFFTHYTYAHIIRYI